VTDLVAARRPFVDGQWVDGEGGELVVESPATEQPIATVEAASIAQVERAIGAARRAFDEGPWPRLTPQERIAAVLRLSDALEARRDVLIETVIGEAGCPRGVTEIAQVGMALHSIRELTDLYGRMPAWEHNEVPLADHLVGSTVRLSIRRYEPGVVNVDPGAGDEGAILLTTHPQVDVVSFTGSTAVGRAVAAQAAPTLKRVILELGGKSVQIHLPDALDGDGGLGGVIGSSMVVFASHAGQGCALQTRLLVPETRKAEVIDAVAAAASGLPVGDPADPAKLVGPLITAAQRDRVHGIVTDAVDAGARLVTGGKAPKDLTTGWFYEPTVLDVPDPGNPVAQREVFGPVLAVLGYRDVDEAVAIANDSELGLSGGVYTGDLALGLSIAERIRSGTVQVNTGWASGYTPMGGYKQSGYGRERGAPGIRAFQELKHVVVGSR
jgi:aldehyde dehydrogenase (NAD+)